MSAPFVHPRGLCESSQVGAGTRIWAFAHVLPGARIGADCNICDHVFIENDVVIGDRVTVKSGVQLWDGIRLADDVFIGPNATFANDKFPRSREWQARVPETRIGPGASLGANCTILPDLSIGRSAMIGAGAVVTADVPPFAIVIGNPARIVGYVDRAGHALPPPRSVEVPEAATVSEVIAGVMLHRLRGADDMRGMLAVAEVGADIPFPVARVLTVHDVPSKDVRGERAHRICRQFVLCVRGSVSLVVDNGVDRAEVTLDRPTIGVSIPPMVWSVLYRHSPDAVVQTLASHAYDPSDYIRDYDEFLRLATAS